jgi:hypothetical protein
MGNIPISYKVNMGNTIGQMGLIYHNWDFKIYEICLIRRLLIGFHQPNETYFQFFRERPKPQFHGNNVAVDIHKYPAGFVTGMLKFKTF